MDHLKRSEGGGGIVGKKKTGKENGWIIKGELLLGSMDLVCLCMEKKFSTIPLTPLILFRKIRDGYVLSPYGGL